MHTADTMTIAVIIPSFNRAASLGRALDSVLAQHHPSAEICVVDDGSTDGTAELMRSRYPALGYLRQSNRGVSAARNLGVAHTQSEWLAFLDSDDEWLPDKLQQQMIAWQRQPQHRLIHCDEIWIRDGRRVNPMRKHQKAGGFIFDRCLPLCAISPSAAVIQRSLFEEMQGFDESLPACEDYDLWLRICCRHPVLFVDQPLLRKYGGHADQLSRQHWGMDRFRVKALKKLLDSQVLTESQRHAAGAMLQRKCQILRAGASKRNKLGEVAYYQELMDCYVEVDGHE